MTVATSGAKEAARMHQDIKVGGHLCASVLLKEDGTILRELEQLVVERQDRRLVHDRLPEQSSNLVFIRLVCTSSFNAILSSTQPAREI